MFQFAPAAKVPLPPSHHLHTTSAQAAKQHRVVGGHVINGRYGAMAALCHRCVSVIDGEVRDLHTSSTQASTPSARKLAHNQHALGRHAVCSQSARGRSATSGLGRTKKGGRVGFRWRAGARWGRAWSRPNLLFAASPLGLATALPRDAPPPEIHPGIQFAEASLPGWVGAMWERAIVDLVFLIG